MSKKQATNTFGKGMMLDLHPLTVPADVLTDALNATIITMNGNEGILQNDMGNGRVESAFLPPGYVPVGIKEYGGIIYVASYNPITNKSQIGSFPSPERNIDQEEEGTLKNPLKLLDETYKRTYKFSKFNIDKCQIGAGNITNKVEIFGNYRIIRSGDKFGFYFNGDNDVSKLSNYFKFDNINNRRLSYLYDLGGWDKSNGVYQNNIITLSTQVLDSNSNLRDLTYQLKRFDDNNKLIKFNELVTEDDKFNCGYFITKSKDENWDSVNQERDKKALNTYNNKLFGKLYLVGRANLVEYIDVQVVTKSYIDESIKNYIKQNTEGNSKILYFHIDYYFNCPEKYLYVPKIFLYYDYEDTGITKFKELTTVYERSSEPNVSNISVTKKTDVTNSNTLVQETLDICHIDQICHNYEIFNIDDIEEQEDEEEQEEVITEDQINRFKFESENMDNYIIMSKGVTQNTSSSESVVVDGQTETHQMNTTTTNYQYYSPDKITYDPLTNLYRKRYVAYLELTDEEYPIYSNSENEILRDDTVLNYIIIPQMKNLPGEDINDIDKQTYKQNDNYITKLTHIATEGSIDLSKIGSGECNIVTWRYICTNDMVKLNWGLEDYPLDTDIITDTRMEFYDWNNIQDAIDFDTSPDWIIYFNQTNYTSINTSISFGENTLKKRHIYIVKLARKKNDNDEIIGWRILITTPIYNELFQIHNDYCSDVALEDILNKNIINITFDISLESSTKTPSVKNKNVIYKKNSVIVKNDVLIPLEEPQETLQIPSVTLYYFKEPPEPSEIPEGYTLFSYNTDGKTYYTYYKVVYDQEDINGYHLEFYDENHDDLIPDDIYNIIDYFDNLKSELDSDTYAQLQYTTFQTNKKIKLNFDIPDIYPFELYDKSKITYKISPDSIINKDMLYSMINEEQFPVIEDLSGHLNEYTYKLFNEDAIYNGESSIKIQSIYNFPSIAIYNFSSNKKRIQSKNTYVSMYEFMKNELPDKILFPYIGSLEFILGTYEYVFDILYIDEFNEINRVNKKHLYSSKYISKDRIKTPSFNLSSYKDQIDKILVDLDLKDSTFLIVGSPITFKNDWSSGNIMDLIFTEINSQLTTKNDNLDDGDDEEYELYESGLNGFNANCMLRHYQYTYGKNENHQGSFGSLEYTDDDIRIPRIRATRGTKWIPDEQGASKIRTDLGNQNFPSSNKWGHKDWFVLLWKNKDGEFTVVNKFYTYDNKYIEEHGIENQLQYTVKNSYYNSDPLEKYTSQTYYNDRTDLKDWIIKQVFGGITESIFFKTNFPKWIEGYPVDMQSIAYNTDYNVDITDVVNINNIKFKDNLLKYYSTGKYVDQEPDNNGNYINLVIPEILNNEELLDDKEQILGMFRDEHNNPIEEENEKINSLCKYLKFELNSEDRSESFDKSAYSIFGMDEFVSNLQIDDQVEGCIVVGDRIYLVDSEGLSLNDNIYVYSDGYIVKSNLINKNVDFVQSLNVYNNKLLINNYNYGKSDTYAISCDNDNSSGIAITISNDIPYLRFEPEDTFNTSVIFGGNWKNPAGVTGSGSFGGSGSGGSGSSGSGSNSGNGNNSGFGGAG